MQTQNITLDFCLNDYKTVTVKQGDKDSRNLIITCTDNGSVYKLNSSTQECNVKMNTPDNRAIFNTATINSDGTISMTFTESMVYANGTGKLEIQIIEQSTKRTLSTMILTVVIVGNVYPDGKVIASDEFSALTEALLSINDSINEAEKAIDRIEVLESTVERAEVNRINAESERQSNEENRQTNTATAIANAEEATAAANTATTNANNATETANTATENAIEATSNAVNATTNANEAAENAIDATQNAIQATNDIRSLEEQVTAAETLRQEQEAIRQENEEKRQTDTITAINNANTATVRANEAANAAEAAAANFEVDDTLSQSGKAADAAVVGEKFSQLSGEIAEFENKVEKAHKYSIKAIKNTDIAEVRVCLFIPKELVSNSVIRVLFNYSGEPLNGKLKSTIYGFNDTIYNLSKGTKVLEGTKISIGGAPKEYDYTHEIAEIDSFSYYAIDVCVYGGVDYTGAIDFELSNIDILLNGVSVMGDISVIWSHGSRLDFVYPEKIRDLAFSQKYHLQELDTSFDNKLLNQKTELINKINEIATDVVYLIGHFGQSNSAGRGTDTKPTNITNKAIYVRGGSYNTLYYGNDFLDKSSSTPQFADWLACLTNENVAIIKYAVGGTLLTIDSDEDTWSPYVDGNLLDTAISEYNKAVTTLENNGYYVVKLGFVWTQGESDYNKGTPENYATYFKDLIEKVRNEVDVADFKCFINLCGDENDIANNTHSSMQVIRDAQKSVADSDSNVFVVSDIAKRFVVDDLNLMKDEWHYTDDGYRLLGKQSAEYTYIHAFNHAYNARYKLESDNDII